MCGGLGSVIIFERREVGDDSVGGAFEGGDFWVFSILSLCFASVFCCCGVANNSFWLRAFLCCFNFSFLSRFCLTIAESS